MAKIVKVDVPSRIRSNDIVGVGLSSWVFRVDAVAKCYTRPAEREREILVYQRLGSHKSILQYYGSLDGSILLQFAPHGTIRQYLESSRHNPPLATRLMWTEQATEAISYLHSNGIFHCDISYNNIFLDGSYNAMVADFAGSSIDDKEALGFYATSHHHPDIEDPSTDSEIFALGSTFYEILTGENPFKGCDEVEIEKNIREGNFPSLEHLPALQKIISKCWECGYQTADELLLEVKQDAAKTKLSLIQQEANNKHCLVIGVALAIALPTIWWIRTSGLLSRS